MISSEVVKLCCCGVLVIFGVIAMFSAVTIVAYLPVGWHKGVCIPIGESSGGRQPANYFSLSDEVVLNSKWNPILVDIHEYKYIHPPKINPHPNGSAGLCYFRCSGYGSDIFNCEQPRSKWNNGISYNAIWGEDWTPFLDNELEEFVSFIVLGISIGMILFLGIIFFIYKFKYLKPRRV